VSVVALIHNYHILFILVAARLATASALLALAAAQHVTYSAIRRARHIPPHIICALDAPLDNVTRGIGHSPRKLSRHIEYSADRSIQCAKKSSSSCSSLCHFC